ncbi:PTS sugar transporter subunit IIC [Hydrogenoanaerobacterium sp.]|uniref:PTS mannose/fructose/sorbose/N-acetylgalactosamine transporter subunit IIC n=1 Tax=Hydrogenoanaerobacterium sp. TaxID=2953763 RepID=UPI0028A2674F|nr:PTS sugar transporter subunit IIC [Hydrogenoanaerobacterium sp.]
MIFEALVVALILYAMYYLGTTTACAVFYSPLLISTLIGMALGDLQTGIMMGAALEGIYMGYASIGGTLPANASLASALAVPFVILTGANMEAALALSVPVATASGAAMTLIGTASTMLAPKYDSLLEQGKYKTFTKMHLTQPLWLMNLPDALIVFAGIAFGMEKFDSLVAMLPATIMHGFSVAGGMLPALGFALLLNMTMTKRTCIFFFVGFVFCKYMNLPIIATSILAIAIAVIVFMADKGDTQPAVAVSAEEGDFFDE